MIKSIKEIGRMLDKYGLERLYVLLSMNDLRSIKPTTPKEEAQLHSLQLDMAGFKRFSSTVFEILDAENRIRDLTDLELDEAKDIGRLFYKPYVKLIADNTQDWMELGLKVKITMMKLNDPSTESEIWIYEDGRIQIHTGDREINTLLITDYLRERGYNFTK